MKTEWGKSTVSLDVLKTIFNSLDINIYVSDQQTDEILFINDRMKKHFHVEGDGFGQTCWQLMQCRHHLNGDTCPKFKLRADPLTPVVWDDYNTVTDRYYHLTDSIIDWPGGGKVHLHSSTDITDLKLAQFSLQKRLQQQELMSTISLSFTGAKDTRRLIEQALRMSGEFMGVNQAFLSQYIKEENSLECLYEWHDEQGQSFIQGKSRWPITNDMQIYRDFIEGGYAAIDDFSREEHPNFLTVQDYAISSFLNIAIKVAGEFWGILGFVHYEKKYAWTESDIHLGKLIAGVFAREIIRNLADEELLLAKEAAEEASRAKGDFLSRMSHEIRSPMNAIIGMTGIARNSPDPEKKEHCLERIDNASQHLLGLINDILDISKIEANKFELSTALFDVEKMLINIAGVVNFRAEEKKQNLIINFDEDVPPRLIGDEMRLSQVITNLLTNATKFTPERGTIVLNVHKIGEADGVSELRIEVIDNGIGISEEQQSRLFNTFEQADSNISRQYGGTGLGLSICKGIVELMEGRIWIESALGQGSKFIFTVKLGRGPEREQPPTKQAIDKDSIRILAVDDTPEMRDYFTNVMAELGFHCDVADGADRALELMRQHKDRQYNIFFVDWMMPDINGIQLARMIKRITHHNAFIVMISVADWSNIEQEARASGVDRFVAKPLFPSTLLAAINESAGITAAAKLCPQKQALPDYNGHSILLVDDMEVNREIICALLENTGIEIDQAADGAEACSKFAVGPDKYDVILMDILMPEMDGFEATQKIRSMEGVREKRIPVLAMTASVFREDVEKCLHAGMDDHIGKPVNTEELMTKLSKYLTNNAKAAASDLGAGGMPQGPQLDYAELLPALDVADGLGRVMNNKKLFFRLLRSFSGRKLADDIIAAIQSGEHTQVQQAAHALKGVSANLGLTELMNIALQIETRAKGAEGAEDLLPDLEQAVEAVTTAIERLLSTEAE